MGAFYMCCCLSLSLAGTNTVIIGVLQFGHLFQDQTPKRLWLAKRLRPQQKGRPGFTQ